MTATHHSRSTTQLGCSPRCASCLSGYAAYRPKKAEAEKVHELRQQVRHRRPSFRMVLMRLDAPAHHIAWWGSAMARQKLTDRPCTTRSQAVRSFEHFCDMYQIDDEANPGHKVWQFDKVSRCHSPLQPSAGRSSRCLCYQDELRPILRANFHLARLYGRSHPLGSM